MQKTKEAPFYYQIKNREVGEKYDPTSGINEELTPQEKAIGEDLKIEYGKALNNFQSYLEIEFVRFEYKMNSCMLKRCYKDIYETRDNIRECNKKCREGLNAINGFVTNTLENYEMDLYRCLQHAQKAESEIMNQTFTCYKTAIDKFPTLKEIIHNEFSFYKA